MLETSFNAVLMTISKTMKRIELYAKSYLNLKLRLYHYDYDYTGGNLKLFIHTAVLSHYFYSYPLYIAQSQSTMHAIHSPIRLA